MIWAAALLVFLAGLAVGATSIGGVLVVPTLTALIDMPVHEAIAISNFSFLFTGATAVSLQRSSPRLRAATDHPRLGPFYLAAFLGAGLGALTLGLLPIALIRSLVTVVTLLSGVMALNGVTSRAGLAMSPVMAICVGFGVGCASAWSGTGGPVLLMPLLIMARVPMLLAMPMAQGIQLPIAGAATVINLWDGRLNLGFGVVLGVLVLLGWGGGLHLARRVPSWALQRVIAIGLIAVGLLYGWQTLQRTA